MPSHALIVALALVSQAPKAAAPPWQTVASTAGGFSVMVPGGSGSTRQSTRTQTTNQGRLQFFIITRQAGNTVFSALKIVPPFVPTKGQEVQYLDSFSSAVVDQIGGGRLVSKRTGNVGGKPALDMTIEQTPPGSNVTAVTRSRFFLVGESLFNLAVTAPGGPSPATNQFFNSLKIGDVPVVANDAGVPVGAPVSGAAPSTDPSKWGTFTSKDGGFAVKVPVRPDRQQEASTLGAKTTQVITCTVQGATYTVQYQDLPADVVSKGTASALDSGRDALAKAAGGTVADEHPATVGGVAGREYRIESPTLKPDVVRVRSVVSGNRLFDLFVTAPQPVALGVRSNAFFESFKFLPQP